MKRFLIGFSVLIALLASASCQFTEKKSASAQVAILAVNDMHSAIDMMPQFAALADSLRGVYPDLLVFSAGDNRTGSPVNDMYVPTNYPMIALMNQVGFDLCAVGNHDWDGGFEGLQRNIEDARFPFLCANLNMPSGVKLDVKPYEIIERQGVSIAVVGLIETRANGLPGAHPRHYNGITFRKGIDALEDYLYLKQQSNVFLLLSHLGFEEDLEVAERYPELDAIIGGHTHTLVQYPEKHNGVMVTQAGSGLKNATLILIKVEDGITTDVQAKTLDVQHVRRKNATVQAMLDEFNSSGDYDEPLATATTDFTNREELGCMVTDAMREASGADFAFFNTGGLRIDRLKRGPITVKDVYRLDPFNNDVVVYQMTGKQMERFVMESYKKNGRYPSFVSGMSYRVNTASDGYPKSVSFNLDHGRFSKDDVYSVAMNSFMASTVRFESVDDGRSIYMTTEDVLIQYLRSHPKVSYKGVSRTSH